VAENLLIFGASARAAAFSALRAGLQPWCADLFADFDLQARCPVMRIPPLNYPEAFRELATSELPGPWMYTGGLENWPVLVDAISQKRPLWGNNGPALRDIRYPEEWVDQLRSRRLPVPTVWFSSWRRSPREGRWLLKPRAGAGGRGIRFWTPDSSPPNLLRYYLQEYIDGDACAALYIGNGLDSWLLGVTQQLVGEAWLHAASFHYCGSIGPLLLNDSLRQGLERLGRVLTGLLGLRGLFGIDCVLREGVPYPVEINPRYTASVEVLEYASGARLLELHRWAFEPASPEPPLGPAAGSVVGKAILFARAPLPFPNDGPWMLTLRQPGDISDLPAFADIPQIGTPIEPGRPILTFFARAESVDACRIELQHIAAELDRWLFR
jgi:predicted ATP-grasp superfamily ATP-dependent carboligase